MGYVIGLICEKWKARPIIVNFAAILAALLIKVVGYYFAEVILYRNWIVPFGSIPGKVMQIVVAAIIVLPIARTTEKTC